MSTTISNLNLANGQQISVPFEVTGTATGTATLIAAARQIDDLPSQDMGSSCMPNVPDASNPTTVDFAFVLTRDDCPDPDAFYMLTLLFWDDGPAPSLSQTSVAFQSLSDPPRPPKKGP